MSLHIQKIIFGSPGTGKSYLIDSHIIPYELSIDKDSSPQNIIKTVFHPEYTHGDFLGKLLPITKKDGKVEYNFYEGHFLRALAQAYKNLMKIYDGSGKRVEGAVADNVVLVIDEINRGNSSSIFGSVFQLLDRDDQGWSSYSINLQGMVFDKFLEMLGVKVITSDSVVQGYNVPLGAKSELVFFQNKIKDLFLDFESKTIKLPFNLSILSTMNTSDNSIYYMDSAFKRRWDWLFVDIDSSRVEQEGEAFSSEAEWFVFVQKINLFIKKNHKYIRGIEDKQIGNFFIKPFNGIVYKKSIQSKLMFFLWDSVFSRDKKPLQELLYPVSQEMQLITFGDFAKEVDEFICCIGKI